MLSFVISFVMRNHIAIGWIVITCLLFSFSGLQGEFVFDDRLAIVANTGTTPGSSFSALWSHDIWGKHMQAHDSHHSYRPFLILLFKLLRIFYDSAVFLRIVSIAGHTIAAVLFYFMAEEVTGVSDLALNAALLFAAHPVHVEAVTAVVNMAEPIHCIFYISVFRIYYRDIYLERSERESRKISIGLWITFVISSILFKETGLTVVGVVLGISIVDLLTRALQGGVEKGIAVRKWWTRHAVWVGLSISMVLSYASFRVLLMNLLQYGDEERASAPGGSGVYLESSDLIRKAENPFAFLHGTELVLSLMYLHFRYMLALLFPVLLCAEYSFDCIPSVKSLYDGRFWQALGMYLLLMGLVLLGIRTATEAPPPAPSLLGIKKEEVHGKKTGDNSHGRRARDSKIISSFSPPLSSQAEVLKHTALIHALVWMAVSFVPASGVFLRLGTLLAERLLYVPSCGFCLVLSLGVHYFCGLLFKSPSAASGNKGASGSSLSRNKISSRLVTVLIWALYLLKSYHQNLVWRDEPTLFIASLGACPRSAKLNLQVAKIFVNSVSSSSQGKVQVDEESLLKKDAVTALQRAQFHVNKAREIDPSFCDLGYQEALLQLLLHKNTTGAIRALVDNLSCKFTARASLGMLESLWEAQISQVGAHSRDGYPLLKQQGEQAAQGGMTALAAQKFSTASQGAIQHSAYLDALLLAMMAEEAMLEWLASEDAEGERERAGAEFAKALEMHAGVLLRGGRIRRLIQRTIEEGQKGLDKQHRGEGDGDSFKSGNNNNGNGNKRPSVWNSVHIPPRLLPELPRAKEQLFAAVRVQQDSFRFVREKVGSDDEATALLRSLGADPKLVPMALELLEEAITGKLDMTAVHDSAKGASSQCDHRQVANLVDYAALQELRNSLIPASGTLSWSSSYTDTEIANLYETGAALREKEKEAGKR